MGYPTAISVTMAVGYECPAEGRRTSAAAHASDVFVSRDDHVFGEDRVYVGVACPSCGKSHDVRIA